MTAQTPRITDHNELVELITQRQAASFLYPEEARQVGWQGWVVVEATVTNDGHLLTMAVNQHSGCEPLTIDAMEQVEKLFPIPADIDLPSGQALTFKVPYSYKHDEPSTPLQVKKLHRRIGESLMTLVRNLQHYPPSALKKGYEGIVLTKFIVNRDGTVRDVKIVKSSGYPELDADALYTINQIGHIPESQCLQPPHTHEVLFPVSYSIQDFTSKERADYEWLKKELETRIRTKLFYPQEARFNRQEGQVIVSAIVTNEGKIARTWITSSSSVPILDQVATFAVQRISPIPLKQSLNQPYLTVSFPIHFSLD